MGFNHRKMEDQRREAAEKEAATRRATDAQVLEDAERLITAWNERQAMRAPMIFSPTIGAAIKAGYWFLWVRCPACRMINAIDLRTLDRHADAAVTSLIPALSCRSCRPNAPFAELVRLSRTSIADEMREEHRPLDMIRTLGALVGAADRADRLSGELAATVGFARKRAAQLRTKPKVYFEEWDEPMISGIAS
jgi:hypothetical protein